MEEHRILTKKLGNLQDRIIWLKVKVEVEKV